MTSEIICALIGAASTILSALIAYLVSRHTTSKEFERLKLTWQREDMISSEDTFGAMVRAVTQFVKHGSDTSWREALSQISSVRARETEDLAASLDELYQVSSRRNRAETEAALTKVIEHKRKIQRESNASLGKKKKK